MVILNLSNAMDKKEWFESTVDSIDIVLLNTYNVCTEARYDMLLAFQMATRDKNKACDCDIDDIVKELNSHLSEISVLKEEYNAKHTMYMSRLGTILGKLNNAVYN